MYKKTIIYTLIIAITCNLIKCKQTQAVFDFINLLDRPIFVSNNSSSAQGELLGMQQTQQFTVQFWAKVPNTQSASKINLFTLLNILPQQREQQYDSTYPDCPFSQNYLQQHPENQKLPSVMSNPNCFTQIQEQEQTQGLMDIGLLFQNDKTYLQLVYISKNDNQSNPNIATLPEIEFQMQTWFFFAVSFDYKNNKANYILDFDGQAKTQSFQLDMPQLSLMKNFMVYFSENQQIQMQQKFPLLYDVNIQPVFYDDLSILRLFNYDNDVAKDNNDLIQLDFINLKDKSITSDGLTKLNYKIEGTIKAQDKMQILDTAHIQLNQIIKDLLPNQLIRSPTFYFSFKIININELILLKFQKEQQFLEIGIKQDEAKQIKTFIRSSDDIGIQFESEKILDVSSFNKIAFSVANIYQKSIIYIWYQDTHYEQVAPAKILVDVDEFQLQLFDNSQSYQIEMFNFNILSNPYPFILQHKISEFQDSCEIYQVPSLAEYNICMTCANGVLDQKKECVEFCNKDQKNINNRCVPCVEENCQEIEFPTFIIQNKDGLEFQITLDKPLYGKTLEQLSKNIKVKISSLKENEYSYSILPVNQNQLDLQINTEKSIYNSKLEVFIDPKHIKNLYTINREKIQEIKSTFQVNSLRVLHTYQEMVLDIISSIIIIVFWILVLFGLLLSVLQFKYSFEDYSFKRLYYVFMNIQFVTLLAFADVPFPSNLNFFCNKIFEYTVKCLGMIKFKEPEQSTQLKLNLENISAKMFSVLLVENMTFVSLLHLFIIVIYALTLIFNMIHKITPFKPKNRERLFTLRDVFEFSFLAMSFLVFTPIIFAYLTINLKMQSKIDSHEKHKISFMVSVFYLICFGFGVLFFFIFYLIKKGFKHHSNIKSKLHFLFNGYTESKNANIYEICQVILTILIAVVLAGLPTKQAPQLTFLVFLQILKVVLISCLKPFMSKWDKFAEVSEKFLWTVVFLGIASLSVFDENRQDHIRVKIGWAVVGIIAFQLFIDFISHFMFCLRFVTNMKKPENIIFYQKAYHFKKIEEEQNNHTLIESQHRGSSFFYDDNEKPGDVSVNPYQKMQSQPNKNEKQKSSFISDKQLNAEDNHNDVEFENMKSGQGALHESYISQSSKSVDKNDRQQLNLNQTFIRKIIFKKFNNFHYLNLRGQQYI